MCWTEERTLFIVMDYYPMTLKDKLVEKLEETEILHFFKQLMKGLKHIHEAGVIHFDIKPDNLFIDEFNNLKIGDFGLAASTGESYGENFAGFVCFDTYFRAPEMQYLSRNLTNKVDIFSAGAVLLEMVISPAMNAFDKMSAFEDAAMGLFPEVVDADIAQFLKQCLAQDSNKRPSANEILSMKF
ncbi:hypothetical protein LIER_43521 [Lithospermum erythrorhizon]|uniref:Protein kinase domain-containing protein n=1 Tax=Lithospermum erythrorhizon TaxID=34254 RepID=A0AAV3Q8K4_LITER